MANELPAGVIRVQIVFVNAYLVDVTPGVAEDGWVLVDTGVPALGSAEIPRVAGGRYGWSAKPRAIILTHGHFDHAGSAAALAARWDVPVYLHRLELPYVTGLSSYPPQDPTVGGALAMMSRAFPRRTVDLRGRVHELRADGTLPELPQWQAVHTPGHTAGHVSLWRDTDRTLLAGDALATMNQESWASVVTMTPELRWPPAPLTTDWGAARDSVRALARLRPDTIAAGHGLPMSGPTVADTLEAFAEHFEAPAHGRYVAQPAVTDERGVVVEVPPPVGDPVGKRLRVGATGALIAGVAVAASRTRRRG